MKQRLSDEDVDLCGELGHPDDDFAELGPNDEFGFRCKGCGGCCKGREDIVLSGYDLYNLCVRLQLPPQNVINGYCRLYCGSVSGLPVVRLMPTVNGNCPFLYKNRCTVHSHKPLVCALYPLGQTIELNGRISYFCQDTTCAGTPYHFTLNDYLNGFSIRQREQIDLEWARLNIGLSKRLKKAPKNLTPLQKKLLQRQIAKALYLNYDFALPYTEQLEQNLKQLEPILDKILGSDCQ